jgi:hypothetical protein
MPNYTNTNFRRFSLLVGIQMFSFFAGVEFARAHYWSAGLYAVAVVFFCSILGGFLYRRSEQAAPAQELTRIDIERMERALGSQSFPGPAGAGREDMRNAILRVAANAKIDRRFEEFLKTLPAGSQQKIRESAARGELTTRDAFRFAWEAASVSEAGRSSIRDDSRFLAFWVMAWMPLMCALFLVVSPYLASSGEMLVTGAYFIFVYVMFAPALYRLFIGGLRHRDRGS